MAIFSLPKTCHILVLSQEGLLHILFSLPGTVIPHSLFIYSSFSSQHKYHLLREGFPGPPHRPLLYTFLVPLSLYIINPNYKYTVSCETFLSDSTPYLNNTWDSNGCVGGSHLFYLLPGSQYPALLAFSEWSVGI